MDSICSALDQPTLTCRPPNPWSRTSTSSRTRSQLRRFDRVSPETLCVRSCLNPPKLAALANGETICVSARSPSSNDGFCSPWSLHGAAYQRKPLLPSWISHWLCPEYNGSRPLQDDVVQQQVPFTNINAAAFRIYHWHIRLSVRKQTLLVCAVTQE
ncbi:hypothetical protein BGZ61DRAFT_184418 [Ilyonectria robusta]|uniref:uncharacterized protein n=1 Tax=Ilyonectria robusta TaxID=1079257 RepID=UPI001E8E4C5A|nr:uncharacterized protein BGZ61DRAFT_184418 [Ilyonectria robusta]KAH8729586.1 hypothetical protein BGZ61DRAFT_184418 [Ilyonectria robusta]